MVNFVHKKSTRPIDDDFHAKYVKGSTSRQSAIADLPVKNWIASLFFFVVFFGFLSLFFVLGVAETGFLVGATFVMSLSWVFFIFGKSAIKDSVRKSQKIIGCILVFLSLIGVCFALPISYISLTGKINGDESCSLMGIFMYCEY